MHFRLSNGLALAYHMRGAGRLVMFLHPIGTRGAFWDPAVQRLEFSVGDATMEFTPAAVAGIFANLIGS